MAVWFFSFGFIVVAAREVNKKASRDEIASSQRGGCESTKPREYSQWVHGIRVRDPREGAPRALGVGFHGRAFAHFTGFKLHDH